MVSQHSPTWEKTVSSSLLAEIRGISRPLRLASDLDPLVARLKDAQVVLLGEASHGTHEYYAWRSAITKELLMEGGFSFVAVEGDWPACYEVNRFVSHLSPTVDDARTVLGAFCRWPTWMWANEETSDLVTWLAEWNSVREPIERVGFFGLDVYSLWDSLYLVMRYLKEHHPEALPAARSALRCFEPFGEDAQEYARFTRLVPDSCEQEAVKLLGEVRAAVEVPVPEGRESRFAAEQNALIVKNAESYYRAMVQNDSASWNIRDRHMFETLDRLRQCYGGKAIVWEHNTHVGDARYTDMADAGMVNLGQLAREAYGENRVAIVGFSSYRGEVIAGDYWDAPWRQMIVPPARPGSWESVLHQTEGGDQFLIFDTASTEMQTWRGQRAIGVVYRPERERYGNYVPTLLPKRYDAVIYLDETTALRPLLPPTKVELEETPETFPSGV